ncbi:MAG: 1,4-alpha-glucan branching protein domain-containing protein [Anaerolineae bacterium]
MGALGAFTFVLHSHLPYVRLAGRWPHGEEWLHEAASETYIPLLQTLYDLKESGAKFKLTLGMTPVLAEQLADPDVLRHLDDYLDIKIAAAQRDMDYYEGKPIDLTGIIGASSVQQPSPANPHLRYLAEWYKSWFDSVKKAFQQRFNRDIIGAFRRLQDDGYIEIATSAATHAYLPLLSKDSSVNAQIQTGIASYERLFGRKPTTFWLPECAYRPAYISENGSTRPGLETWLARHGLKVFFTETHTITGGQPVGIAAGDVLGPYGEVKRRYVIPVIQNLPERPATTYQAYFVTNTVAGTNAGDHSGVVVIGRNNRTGQQVWSADWGYPGDFDYREFHKKAGTSGLQYWRVTGAKVELGRKDYYHPDWAAYKIDQHAEHYAHLVGDLLRDFHNNSGKFGIIASNYDGELFGHWWFEGVSWLGKVLQHLSENPDVEISTAGDYVANHQPQETISLPEGSWGAGGTHFMWDNGDTHWMWQPIHEAEARMEALVAQFPNPSEDEHLVLSQTARELLLLQSSDWAFLVTTGQAREYATQRFSTHLERFNALALGLEGDTPNRMLAEEYFELDRVFPDIDYRWFAAV